MNQKAKYRVVVGNVGTMEYSNKRLALECYATYVTLSMHNQTRAAGESVALFYGDELVREYEGNLHITLL